MSVVKEAVAEHQDATVEWLKRLGWVPFANNLAKSLPGPIYTMEFWIRKMPGGARTHFRVIVGRRFTTVYRLYGGTQDMNTYANGSDELAARIETITPEE